MSPSSKAGGDGKGDRSRTSCDRWEVKAAGGGEKGLASKADRPAGISDCNVMLEGIGRKYT